MPYTPPAQQSPSGSLPDSPVLSRRASYSQSLQQQHQFARTNTSSNTRPSLPRSANSASYLHRHRRSPSLIDSPTDAQLTETPESTPTGMSFDSHSASFNTGGSVRQSPPPVNDLQVPTGAVISPPDSTQNSSDDDEDAARRGRTRDLENLAELQAVVQGLEQQRSGSPTKVEAGKPKLQLGLPGAESPASPMPRSPDGRISHTRAVTESAIIDLDRPSETPERSADSDEDEGRYQKPPMLRKKSGELVRPALRPASAKRRPSSMPGTPTYSKAVHFDSHLEHVRTFLQVDRPLAVSVTSSPVETYDGDSEFPFHADQRDAPWQWEIKLCNFPTVSYARRQLPVHVERVFLSADNKTLIGTVAVQNLAFHKLVVARFTLDYWKTTSEVVAEFSHDVRRATADNLDRFNFNIRLEDLANLENKTLLFCVRYNVNGQEYWDSNHNGNFQVDFAKKPVPQKGKSGMAGNAARPLNGLPRSRPSPPVASRPRPKSDTFEDFASGFPGGFGSPGPAPFTLNDTPLKFRPRPKVPATSPSLNPKAPSQPFGNRYDFASSLSAAIQRATLGERTNRPAATDSPEPEVDAVAAPAALTARKPDLSSSSYNELIDKYCFFGSGAEKPSAANARGRGAAQLDGADDSVESSVDSTPAPSPPEKRPLPVQPRPASPATGRERPTSPINFGYPYHTTLAGGIFDSGTPTAITS